MFLTWAAFSWRAKIQSKDLHMGMDSYASLSPLSILDSHRPLQFSVCILSEYNVT